jgi:hypothetical protein
MNMLVILSFNKYKVSTLKKINQFGIEHRNGLFP